MSKIRLHISSASTDRDFDTSVTYKEYVKGFINNTMQEIKTQLNMYHSAKEIECRKSLSTFFRQKIADFELMNLVDLGVQYLSTIRSVVITNPHESIADRLAFVYVNLKNTIAPHWNIRDALNNMYFDELFHNNRTGLNDTKYIELFIRICLQKEDLGHFEKVDIKDNLIILDDKYKVAICGELDNPQYKLLNYDKYVFDFTFERFVKYLRLEKKYNELYDIYERFKQLTTLKLDGIYRKFTVTIDTVHVEVNEEVMLRNFNEQIQKECAMHCGLKFSYDVGWMAYVDNLHIVDVLDTEERVNIITEDDARMFVYKYQTSSIMTTFASLKCFDNFKTVLQVSRHLFLPVRKKFGFKSVDDYLQQIVVKNIRICNISMVDDMVNFNLFVKCTQVYVNDKLITFEKKACAMPVSAIFFVLENPAFNLINSLKDVKGHALIESDHILFCIAQICIRLYEDKCTVDDVVVKDLNLYLLFVRNIYSRASRIIIKNFAVEIDEYKIEYAIYKDKIISSILNTEVYALENINSVLKHLKMFYKLNLVPDLVTQRYVIFYHRKFIFKMSYIQSMAFTDDELWFSGLKKTVIKDGRSSKADDLSLHEFMRIYKA